MDLIRGEDGGSLVIDTDEGQIRFDLKKTDDGGFLSIDSDDGQVRVDLIKGEDGGSLVINSEDGEVRFDVQGGENGGSMVVRTDESTLHFGAGDEAQGMPGWVRRADGMPSDPQKVYSLESQDSFMGAVAWESEESARELLAFYRGWLEGEGFELSSEHSFHGEGSDGGSLWARNEETGRVVFLVVGEEDGLTDLLLGYGEGDH